MILIRSALFTIVFYAVFVALMIVGLPCLLLPRSVTMSLVRLWASTSVWLLAVLCGTRMEFRNLDRLPKGASILAVKHQSFLETFALITVLDDFSYVLKKELTQIPFFGWYVRATEQIGIDRERKAATLLALQRAVRDKLAGGRQVIIFPEGTRRPVDAPVVYKAGVAALVADSHVRCTPVALNSGLFWPRHTFLRRPGTVVIEFLPAIPEGLGKRAFMVALAEAIEPATNALVAEAVSKDPGLAAMVGRGTARPRPSDRASDACQKTRAPA